MSKSLTSLVNLKLDLPAFEKTFSIYRVSLENSIKGNGFARQISLIEQDAKPKSLVRHSGYYWILLERNSKPSTKSSNISFEHVNAKSCGILLLARLLIRALGKISSSDFFSGLGETYLFVEPDKFYDHTIYKCLKFDFKESVRFDSLFIDMQGTTFSPIEAVINKPQSSIDKEPKFKFELSSGVLRRHPNGELIIHSPGKKKFTTNAIDISDQKPISLLKTKTGAIYKFIDLMNKHFSGILNIELKSIKATWREHYKKKDIQNIYQKIYQVIDAEGGLQIINVSLENEGFNKLKSQNWPVKVEFVDDQNLDRAKPTLVILDQAKQYESTRLKDPKADYYSSSTVTQSVYNSTIVSIRPKKDGNELQPLIDTWIKEIAIKLECLRGRFMIQDFAESYWFIDVEKSKNKEPKFHILKCENGHFKYEQHDEFYFDGLDIFLPEKKRFFEDLCFVIDMSGNNPQICTIVHEQIAAIPEAEKLFEVLNHLEKSNQQGMSRLYISEYLTNNLNVKNHAKEKYDPIIAKLQLMLNKKPLTQEFFKEDLKSAGVGYRSNTEKALIDGYFEKTGIMLNYSLKGEHNDYLEALTGHFYDTKHSAYFVGSEKGGFKFSRGQFNHVRYLDGPDYLKQKCLDLTKSYFIRNKLATVRPFPFKHLSELRKQQKIGS